jgi:glycosyltransferase involved in cell wall biosynthesis
MQDNIPEISFGILVKNQEQYIEKCIASIIGVSAEIIIIDTGSTDKTIEKINKFDSNKIRFFSEKWRNNFSDHKNSLIKYSSYDIFFMIDSDEELIIEDLENFIEELKLIKNGIVLSPKISNVNDSDIIFSEQIITRRVFDSRNFLYHGYIHEELRKDESKIMDFQMRSCQIKHFGYSEQEMKNKDKINRNSKLLKKQIAIEPENMRWRMQYAKLNLDINFGLTSKVHVFDNLLNEIRMYNSLDLENIIYFEKTVTLITLYYLSIGNLENLNISCKYLRDNNNIDILYIELMTNVEKISTILKILDKLDSNDNLYSSIDDTFDYILVEIIWYLYIENNALYKEIIGELIIEHNKISIMNKIKLDIDKKTEIIKDYYVHNNKAKF